VAGHRPPVLVLEDAEERDDRPTRPHGGECLRQHLRAVRIVRDVEDQPPGAVEAPGDRYMWEHARNLGEVWRHVITGRL
jgi:hypothetical protein